MNSVKRCSFYQYRRRLFLLFYFHSTLILKITYEEVRKNSENIENGRLKKEKKSEACIENRYMNLYFT